MSPSLSILITHYRFGPFEGSQTATYASAVALGAAGHEAVVYSPALGPIADRLAAEGVEVTDSISSLSSRSFDVIHAQHAMTAALAAAASPASALVFHSHGVVTDMEQPPRDVKVQRHIAVSEEVREALVARGVRASDIDILRNAVDTEHFSPGAPIREEPKTALILSNRMGPEHEDLIRQACTARSIEVERLGGGAGVSDVRPHMMRADIVFSLGRGVLEAMACGRAAFVFDYMGADGWVTKDSVDEIQRCNFSGRRFASEPSLEELTRILGEYSPDMGEANRLLVEERFSMHVYLPALLETYGKARSVEFEPRKPPAPETLQWASVLRDYAKASTELQRMLDDSGGQVALRDERIRQLDGQLRELSDEIARKESEVLHLQEQVASEQSERIFWQERWARLERRFPMRVFRKLQRALTSIRKP